MRAAIYARVSTERQGREQTIASQVTPLQEWVRTQGHELLPAHLFIDEGYSGARLDRPGLDRLRDAVQDAAIDLVAVLSPDRLARKYAYQVLLLEEFRQRHCEIVFLQRPLSDDPNDQLLLQIQGAIAEYERALLGERFRRGKLQKAREGHFIGGRAPYGYRYIPKQEGIPGHLLIDEAEATFVRMLYAWLIDERLTSRQLLKRLNVGPWLPRSGKKPWSAATVHHILTDPIYTGTAYTNRYRFVPPKKPRTPHRSPNPSFTKQPRPREEWIAIPVPAVIDQQTHDLAAAQLARNATLSFRHNTKRNYLLRCLLRCQNCGLAMCGITHKAGSGHVEVGYYVCSGKDLVYSARTERCRQRRVRMDELDAAVWGHLCTLLREPAQLLAQFEAFAQRDPAGGEAQAEKVAMQVARLAREEQRLIDAYQGEVISLDELRQRRERLQQQREALERQREAYARQREQAVRAQEVLTDLTAFCERVSSRLAAASFSEQQTLVQLLIEKIIVGEGTLEIHHVIPLHRAPSDASGPGPPVTRLRSHGMNLAPLPARALEVSVNRRFQSGVRVAGNQLHSAEPTGLEIPEQGLVSRRALGIGNRDRQDLPVPVSSDTRDH